MEILPVRSSRRNEWIDITAQVGNILDAKRMSNGYCVLFVPHTTAAITINEGADPSVRHDVLEWLARWVPHEGPYRHREGNADAHIKATLVGSSVLLPVHAGRLALGKWQAVFFCEFDGPRDRRVQVHLTETPAPDPG